MEDGVRGASTDPQLPSSLAWVMGGMRGPSYLCLFKCTQVSRQQCKQYVVAACVMVESETV